MMYPSEINVLIACEESFVHPQSPTTTPLYRRVAKNPHITLAGLCPWRLPPCGAASHGQNSCLCDEGRAVGTFFVGSAPIPSPTGSVWGLRIDVLGAKAPAPFCSPSGPALRWGGRYGSKAGTPTPLFRLRSPRHR